MQNSSNNRYRNNNNNKRKTNSDMSKSENNKSSKVNDKQKKSDLNARNDKAKYNDDEISKARWLESQAIFLVRDRISNENIDTRNKWIHIKDLKKKDKWNSKGQYTPEILSFKAELFDRTEQPKYDEEMSEDEKHQLTFDVAERDIAKQQKQEERKRKKENRPEFYVDVEKKRTNNQKTEYQIKNIKKK